MNHMNRTIGINKNKQNKLVNNSSFSSKD